MGKSFNHIKDPSAGGLMVIVDCMEGTMEKIDHWSYQKE
jgi:hypothetical protein